MEFVDLGVKTVRVVMESHKTMAVVYNSDGHNIERFLLITLFNT